MRANSITASPSNIGGGGVSGNICGAVKAALPPCIRCMAATGLERSQKFRMSLQTGRYPKKVKPIVTVGSVHSIYSAISSCKHRMLPSGSENHAAFSEPRTQTCSTVLKPGRS